MNTNASVSLAAEASRIRDEYESRRLRIDSDRYHLKQPASFFCYTQTARAVLRALAEANMFPLEAKTVADIGCGPGDWLLDFLRWGAHAENLCGIDLDTKRIETARQRLPASSLSSGDATNLPWRSGSIDIVLQFTMFTSILDPLMKKAVAGEMARVVKPEGLILWYDFCFNNLANSAVQGIPPREVRELFPGFNAQIRRMTLAPPLARALVPLSWTGAVMLESIPLLRTHCLAVIRKSLEA
jgi:SAM-dependent methyltransferase